MPAAKDDRKPVGTLHCSDCESEAALYQVARGKRQGYLYKRCACGADQSTGQAKQKRWLQEMKPTGHPMLDHPLGVEPEPEAEPVETPPEPEPKPPQNPAAETNRASPLGFFALAAAVAVALIS